MISGLSRQTAQRLRQASLLDLDPPDRPPDTARPSRASIFASHTSVPKGRPRDTCPLTNLTVASSWTTAACNDLSS